MADRILIAAVIFAAGILLYWMWTRLQLVRVRREHTRAPGLESLERGRVAILYFTTPDCIPCKTIQMPALEKLLAETRGALQVIRIDATEHPQTADYWGVLGAPTTFLIDSHGRARRVNHGVANAAKLRAQLKEIGEWKFSTSRDPTLALPSPLQGEEITLPLPFGERLGEGRSDNS
ncbi:MAG: thioredoxin family protein [Chloroflexi bacterium]|nr:thioredoxin family protein [Chloroflexota bacterium]